MIIILFGLQSIESDKLFCIFTKECECMTRQAAENGIMRKFHGVSTRPLGNVYFFHANCSYDLLTLIISKLMQGHA